MIHDFILIVTTWITHHPHLPGLVIFISSFAESLAFFGLIMPGAALMLTAGALIANNALSFWPTMGWPSVAPYSPTGSVIGWFLILKNVYVHLLFFQNTLKFLNVSNLSFTNMLANQFFGVDLLGRFGQSYLLWPGMLGMERGRFTIYNFLSAPGRAPAYLLPGMAFGASLTLAGEVTSAGGFSRYFNVVFLASIQLFP